MLQRGKGSIVNVASIMGLIGGGVYPNPAYQPVREGGQSDTLLSAGVGFVGYGSMRSLLRS